MNKREIYDYLQQKQLWHEIIEHQAVYTMAEMSAVTIPYPEADAKNLFVRDDKKRNHYLITVRGDKRVNLKEFRRRNGTRPLSFAPAEELLALLGLTPGSVTPLGLLNDEEHRVQLFLDKEFLDAPGLIGMHPNENTATVFLKTEDLIRLLEERGSTVSVADLSPGEGAEA